VCEHEKWKEIIKEYPDGYSRQWRNAEMKKYVEKHKEHEKARLSTNERLAYWRKNNENI
jgi:hypothetical protein|tara:strand:- start:583 stop:759 length:177 start_codon:yes stop_codon:yes gene_type:complete